MASFSSKFDYCRTLSSDAADRYRQKISGIGNIDPYQLDKSQFSDDIATFKTLANLENMFFSVFPAIEDVTK